MLSFREFVTTIQLLKIIRVLCYISKTWTTTFVNHFELLINEASPWW